MVDVMLYPVDFERKIGFEQLRGLLKRQCICSLGEKRVDDMKFTSDFEIVVQQVSEVDELVRIMSSEHDEFPLANIFDLEASLQRIKVEGTYLTEKELFDLKLSLECAHRLVSYLESREEQCHFLCKRVRGIEPMPDVVRQIDSIVDKYGTVKDSASEQLAVIRRNLRLAQSAASSSLAAVLQHAKEHNYIDKDVHPTLREGRLVLPVSPMHKSKIKGIVHDESATGKTIFIEPSAVVEANNRIRELESQERREIIAILVAFATTIRPFIPQVMQTQYYLGLFDFIRAKALVAIELGAIKPHITNACEVDWHNAVHPLLLLALRNQHKAVVPLRIKLNAHQRIVVISGANAGGKSVCLKTVALLQYMLQCGMLVPLEEGSTMGLFERIFIDIGDEQSIENDLSTYSSHLMNMKFFIRNANQQTLMLIDEFGAGTEPQIGGAIAEAVLNHLNDMRAFGVITTHYTNLKQFAETHQGVVNGAMLYDRHRMQPLFQLQIGNPGSSFAIEIARKIGLPESVIAEATAKVGSGFVDLDKYLQDIVRDKRYWENKRQSIRQKEKQTDELIDRYTRDLNEVHKQQKAMLREAQEKANQLLLAANAQIENTIRRIKESQASREVTKQAREDLKAFQTSLQHEAPRLSAEQRLKKVQPKRTEPKVKPVQDATLHVGDCVRMKDSSSAIGTIISLDGKQAVVAFGNLKSKLNVTLLEKSSRNMLRTQERTAFSQSQQSSANVKQHTLNFKPEIDIRGMRADEAQQAVTYFMDDALMVGIDRVRILHGTGNGVLRQVVRAYLSTIQGVRYHDEHVQFGGAGITVVEI